METKETSTRERLDSAEAQLIIVSPNPGELNNQTEEDGTVFNNSMLDESG